MRPLTGPDIDEVTIVREERERGKALLEIKDTSILRKEEMFYAKEAVAIYVIYPPGPHGVLQFMTPDPKHICSAESPKLT